MPFCPKCEEEFREGFSVCADCGVDLVARLKGPDQDPERAEAHAAEFFAEVEDGTKYCPDCFTEFVERASRCGPCDGVPLEFSSRSEMERRLGKSPLDAPHAAAASAVEAGLVRVLELSSPVEAGIAVQQLAGMGVEARIGHDGLDPADDDSRVGIWVPADEEEAARMLIPDDLKEWFDDDDVAPTRIKPDPVDVLLRQASAYREIRKYRHAVQLLTRAIELDGRRFEAFYALGLICQDRGDRMHAIEAYRSVMELLGRHDATDAGFRFALCSFRDDTGKVEFRGPLADAAIAPLDRFTRVFPRRVAGLALLLEARAARGEKAPAREVAARLEKINRRVFDVDGVVAAAMRRIGT